MFNDLRVLGKSDFKLLLKWRLKSRELLRLLRKKKAEKEGMTADLEDDEEEEAADTQKDKKFDEMDDDEKEMGKRALELALFPLSSRNSQLSSSGSKAT